NGADIIDGGEGWDVLDVSTDEAATVNLADGTVDGVGFEGTTVTGIEEVWGGGGDDTITGSDAAEDLYGWNGNDTISGGGGNDYIEGESGNDILSGGAGDDTLKGGSGDDILRGGAGDDTLRGNVGDDIFIYEVGDGSDTVVGGSDGGWTDAVELQGFSANSYGADWTLELTSGSVVGESETTLDLSDDASGTITMDDGSTIDFQQLEQINW
ncbi:MAG: calcium-binding protein, partial [Hyphomicrobiales bacterium]